MQGQWFESWFDSPWYPILYSHRDYEEAERFISKLLDRLAPPPQSKFLDLACGRGRHSIFLHRHGYDVTGLDLSAASIADAHLSATDGLRFAVHDMREPLVGQYDYILNLFTSFGYFPAWEDNLAVLQNAARSLLPHGTFVLDYFNVHKVLQEMVPSQNILRGGIDFHITKCFQDGEIVKTIDFEENGNHRKFQERVKGYDRIAFERLFATAGLCVQEVWGDYNGAAFQPDTSPRLILFGTHHTSAGGKQRP